MKIISAAIFSVKEIEIALIMDANERNSEVSDSDEFSLDLYRVHGLDNDSLIREWRRRCLSKFQEDNPSVKKIFMGDYTIL